MSNLPPASPPDSRPLDAATARRLAVEASCDPKTLRKALAGEPVRGDAGRRAREALVRHGFVVQQPKA